ncbi:MAG TPA: hypothetical protein VGD88_12005 [Opitutaceae bacterium]
MSSWLQRFAFRWLARSEVVPVAECVHFGAFRYGTGGFNPYENYAVRYLQGQRDAARAGLVEFLRHYRPVDLASALGVTLSRSVGLWEYPWMRRAPVALRGPRPGWYDDPAEIPDIVTHFSERGILQRRIEEEFAWLEQTADSIRQHGYCPDRFGGDIQVRCLIASDGARRYLVYDGNHRLSAMAAVGIPLVRVRYVPGMTLRESALSRWRGVVGGAWTAEDATTVFHAYFPGRQSARTTEIAATVLP